MRFRGFDGRQRTWVPMTVRRCKSRSFTGRLIRHDTQCHNFRIKPPTRSMEWKIGVRRHQVTLEGFGRVLCVTLDDGDLVGVWGGIWTWLIERTGEIMGCFGGERRIWWFDWSAGLSQGLIEVWRYNWLIHK